MSFCLGNRLLGNDDHAAGLEMTMNGAHLRFTCDTQIVLTDAAMKAFVDESPIEFWQVLNIKQGQILRLGTVIGGCSRSYLLLAGGIDCPDYLDSKATFTLGQFGGHAGRTLRVGDSYLRVEYCAQVLNIELRFQVHQLMLALQDNKCAGIEELTPGIRSLQIHYNARVISMTNLLEHIIACAQQLVAYDNASVPSRIVHLPLSWDDLECQIAIDKYHQSVREQAFDEELSRWKDQGQFHFEEAIPTGEHVEHTVPEGMVGVDSPASGSLWEHLVKEGSDDEVGQTVSIIEPH